MAIAILSIALMALFRSLGEGVRAAGSSEDLAQVQLLASNLLDQAKLTSATEFSSAQGRTGKFRWSIRMSPIESTSGQVEPSGWSLFLISVTVSGGRAKEFELQTLKLLRPRQ